MTQVNDFGLDGQIPNPVTSFNKWTRQIVADISGSAVMVIPPTDIQIRGLNTPVKWYPGLKPQKPEMPHVYGHFFSYSDWNKSRRKLVDNLQIGVITNEYKQQLAWSIAGQISTRQGFSTELLVMEAAVPQWDFQSGITPAPALQQMILVPQTGWENVGDSDPAVTHLVIEYFLYHE